MTTLQALPLPSNFEDLCELFLLYIAYSTLGWCGEMLYCSIPKGHICEKRGFLNGFLFRSVSRVSFLPQEFSSTQKHTRTHLPTHHVSPLVTEDRKITIRLNPVFISIPNNRFRSRTNNIFLLQFGSRVHNYPTSIRIIF